MKNNIEDYGKYRLGLTKEEIKKYLKMRANTNKLGGLYKKFCKIAGVNTVAIVTTDCCKKDIRLMYRWDVERFADVLFLNKPTYFD